MNDQKALLNRRVNQLLYGFESQEYDRRHPETIQGDRSWWEDFGRNYIRGNSGSFKILDIGTGTGLVPLCVAKSMRDSHRIICYDISAEMLKEARKKLEGNTGCVFVKGDAGNLPFCDGVFDAVVFNSLLHHLLDYRRLLRESDRVLKKGGILAFSHEPNKKFLQSRLCRILANVYNVSFPINLTDELRDKVNAELKKEKLIEKDFSKDQIRRLVEFHSPMEQSRLRVDSSKGFLADQLICEDFSGYRVLELSEYSTYFHRPLFQRVKLMFWAVRSIRKLIFRRGNLFRMVLQK
jgi:ubiquinone/menaquinone biosynthesis C-methylase UbiE